MRWSALLALGGVDGGQDQIVLVAVRRAGVIAGGLRRIEGEVAQEPLAARMARGDLLELVEVRLARPGELVQRREQRIVEGAHMADLALPQTTLRETAHQADEPGPQLS